jgi:hypothetical protein
VTAYCGALLTWLFYTVVKSPAREAGSALLRPQRWEQGLTDIHHPVPADSLIPMFEGMVDRALSRSPISPVIREEGQGLASASVPLSGGSGLSALSAKAGSKSRG